MFDFNINLIYFNLLYSIYYKNTKIIRNKKKREPKTSFNSFSYQNQKNKNKYTKIFIS